MVEGYIQLFFLFSRQAAKKKMKEKHSLSPLKTVCLLFVSVNPRPGLGNFLGKLDFRPRSTLFFFESGAKEA